jgi:hypothetical protein
MAFSRLVRPQTLAEGDVLTSALVGIGINLAAEPAVEPNIEDTLLAASVEGMERQDLRVAALLVTWFGIHAAWVNADRLIKIIAEEPSRRVRTFWAALARWQASDRRFSRLVRLRRGPRVDLLPTGTDFQIRRHGEDPRFASSALRVPANLLRDRPADVHSPTELARRHRAYRCRLVIGPSYRADMWAALDTNPGLSAAALARRTYGSFATAWHVRRDHGIVCRATSDLAEHETS